MLKKNIIDKNIQASKNVTLFAKELNVESTSGVLVETTGVEVFILLFIFNWR